MTTWQEIKALFCRVVCGYWPAWFPDEHLTSAGKRKKINRSSDQAGS